MSNYELVAAYQDLDFLEFLYYLSVNNVITVDRYNNYSKRYCNSNEDNDVKLEILDDVGLTLSVYEEVINND